MSISLPWHPQRVLIVIGGVSLLVYGAALLYGPFRPERIEGFFLVFFAAFALYALATWVILASKRTTADRPSLMLIFGFAVAFNAILFPSLPTLSDDMYRYIWDGRVQASGINPYRYPSNAPELASLRDTEIWTRMNRPSAITVYPPGAELTFAVVWRLLPDSIGGMKVIMIGATLAAGGLLMILLCVVGGNPARAIIFLWNPLLIFEIAHSAHVDALYLPLLVGALLLRVLAPADRTSLSYEIGIGALLGLATLMKLYPLILIPALWSVRRATMRDFVISLALPVAALVVIAFGYILYIAPGVDTLGFLPSYSHEFFNIAPIPMELLRWAERNNINYYLPSSILMPTLVMLISLGFILRPAQTARDAIMRCAWPIGIYLLVTINLFSWYVLWMLPFVAIDLRWGHFAALGWWLFSGLVILSYTLFITGHAQEWAAWIQFIPLYGLLALSTPSLVLPMLRRHSG